MISREDEGKLHGLRATMPREKILRIFQREAGQHLSAEDVFKTLLAENADIGLATVYRVLLQFTQAGLLVRQHFNEGPAVFELNAGQHHDHMVCVHCGRVQEFFDEEIERRQSELAQRLGFELREHSLALYGLCSDPGCRSPQS